MSNEEMFVELQINDVMDANVRQQIMKDTLPFSQNGSMDYSDYLELYNSSSSLELEKNVRAKLEEKEKKIREQVQNIE